MIKINLKVTNIEATPGIRAYLDKKLAKFENLAEKEQDEVILRVEIGRTSARHKEGDIYRAEMQTYLLGKDLRAVAEEEDLYKAIDVARDEMIREATNNKDRRDTIFKKSGRMAKNIIKRFYE